MIMLPERTRSENESGMDGITRKSRSGRSYNLDRRLRI